MKTNERETDMVGKNDRTPVLSMGALIGIAAGLGLVLGVLFDNLVLWMIIGAGLGTVAGAVLESRRR